MAYSAIDIAKYVINYEIDQGRTVTNLRLQKLLYFVQAKVLMETEYPCFNDVMEAWEYGPVVPAVYKEFCRYRNLPIEKQSLNTKIESTITALIENILEFLSGISTSELVQITHCQDPWVEAKKKGNRQPISISAIGKYFKD